MRSQRFASLLLACAEESGAGLEGEESGALVVYANDIRIMLRFAEAIMRRGVEIENLPQ